MPERVADPEVRSMAAADEPLILAAIERARDTWLTAEQIAADCGLPPDRVRAALDATMADIIVMAADGAAGPEQYSTRRHYRATTSLPPTKRRPVPWAPPMMKPAFSTVGETA